MTDNFAQSEVEFILTLGGIKLQLGQKLGENLHLSELRGQYDAVFLAFGLADVHSLRIEGEDLPGVVSAVDYIAQLRQAEDLSRLSVGRRVIVIGGGSTAIDVAVQTKRLGAESVTMVYRRGVDKMSATWKEREFAQKNGVLIKTWAQPHKIKGDKEGVTEVVFEWTQDLEGKLQGRGEYFTLPADVVFKAIGQKLVAHGDELDVSDGKIAINQRTFETTLKGVFAGGDSVFENDLTVYAVQHGKLAAQSIHTYLLGKKNGRS